jgi:hypothetical protein
LTINKKLNATDKNPPKKMKQNENKVRTAQLLAPFGIGQIHNFPNDVSIMTGGLNLWDEGFKLRENQSQNSKSQDIIFNRSEFEVSESRLIKRIGVKKLYKPFAWKKKDSKSNSLIPVMGVRFPLWFHCLNCGRMKKLQLLGNQEIFYCEHNKNDNVCKGRMIPVRFVAICSQGHIEDVPFDHWVHNGIIDNQVPHSLEYIEQGGAGDLSNIRIKCSCGKSKSLGGLTNEEALRNIGYTCKGMMPWLGKLNPDSSCEENLQVVLKGASNVHFTKLVSSIYIPDEDENIEKAEQIVARITIDRLKEKYNLDPDNLLNLRFFIQDRDEVSDGTISADFLFNYILDLLTVNSETSLDEEVDVAYRFHEYKKFVGSNVKHKELITKRITFFNDYLDRNLLTSNFESIVLLERMRETNAFTGFTRLNPENNLLQKERIAMLSDEVVEWLPANVVNGEGLFFQFNQKKIQKWEKSLGDIGGFSKVITNYHQYQTELNNEYITRDLDPVFLMIHTFAHLLIKRLCYNCGYGSSSLKERIYYSNIETTKMYGVLIYTAASDSEGSLGGLVNQGREQFLSKNINEALEDASWCSADPVCLEVGLSNGQGPGSANGAACHNCAIVSETSCEEFNLLLDRTAVIGTLENPEYGFFNFNL